MLYISPPFGNYFDYGKQSTKIRGTFTFERRNGLVYHTLRSLRPVKGGWRNQIGFRNKGLRNIKKFDPHSYYSIAALDNNWIRLFNTVPKNLKIELNVGCPNVGGYEIRRADIKTFTEHHKNIIVKVSPYVTREFLDTCQEMGVKTIHLSNTIPTKRGGISGAQLKELCIPLVESTAKAYNMDIIAGGGIYSEQDVFDYANAGAKHFSVSTVLITKPWKVSEIHDAAWKISKSAWGSPTIGME